MLLETWGRLDRLAVTKKGAVDLLTQADQASEALITAQLQDLFPADAIVGEESGASGAAADDAPFTWVIDPLDGTTNYVHGCRHFAVSIGLLDHAGEPVAGAIHAPVYRETYFGEVGEGAWSETPGAGTEPRRLAISTRTDLGEALLATGFPYDRRRTAEDLLKPVYRVLTQARGFRRMGAASLDFVDVARGAFDGFFEPRLAPWDMAAGSAIVRAAGGIVSAYGGAPFDVHGASVIASNPRLHASLVALVAGGEAG